MNMTKFARLLSRICESFNSETEYLFTDAEMVKLCEMFNIELFQLKSVLCTSKAILYEIAYNNYDDNEFCVELQKKHQLSDDMAELFSGCWQKYRDLLLSQMKQKTNIFNKLQSVTHTICNEISQSNIHNRNMKMANIQFKMFDCDTQQESLKNVNFKRPELYKLYNEMERIQEVLDQLA